MEPTSTKTPYTNRCGKRVEKRASAPVNPGEPGGPAGSGKSNKRPTERQQKEDNLKERSSERSMQRDKPRPSNTPRAPSGPERILEERPSRVLALMARVVAPPNLGRWPLGGPWVPRGPCGGSLGAAGAQKARLWRACRSSIYIYIYIHTFSKLSHPSPFKLPFD